MIYKKDNSLNILATGFLCLIVIFPIFIFLHFLDYKQCYQRAKFFNTKVKKYSFLKRKCIIESNGKKYNLNSLDN